MADEKADDPRVGAIVGNSAGEADVWLIGYPCDEGCVRNGGRSGAAEGPSVFRRFLNRTGTLDNREFNVDLSDLIVFDRGDVERQSMENALHALKSRTYAALAQDTIAFVVGGSNEQSYSNANALMQKYGGNIGVINIDAHLDVRPLLLDESQDRTVMHSGSPFRCLLEDRKWTGKFVEFAAQGAQCSGAHVDYVHSKGGEIFWLRDIEREDAPTVFQRALETVSEGTSAIFVSFDIDSIRSSDCPGVSCPSPIGLTSDEALTICRMAGRHPLVQLVDISEFNPLVEDYNTGKLAALMFYHFLIGLKQRKSTQ